VNRLSVAVLLLLPAWLAACASGGATAPATEPQSAPAPPAARPPPPKAAAHPDPGARTPDASKSGDTTRPDDRAKSEEPSRTDRPAAGTREVTPDRTHRERLPAGVQSIRDQMDEAYQSGLEAYQAGRFSEAKLQFDHAVDVVLSAGLDLTEYPSLKAAFDEMVSNIADMDAELYNQEPAGESGASSSPLDSLKDITTYLTPEEAEKERQKIQQVVGTISYDIPITLNSKVLAYIEAFQTRIRDEFEAGLKRSGGYLPLIKAIFRQEGLPEDLAYMAHQESAFKTNAYSRARAKGMWQFMSFTGRKYNLRVDAWVDERSDFEKATRAAAAYLRDLHERYGDWYLAMAAYNAGEGKIDRAVARAHSKDFWAIAKTRYIRAETKSYVPAILASILIDKSPGDYGFDVDIDAPLRWETVEIDKATDLQVIADGAGATLETIRLLNPELRGLVTPPGGVYKARIPTGSREALLAKLADIPDDKRVSWSVHESRPGETFSTIAHKYKVPVKTLVDANPRYAGKRLPRGTLLNVPLVSGMPIQVAAVAEDRPSYEQGEKVMHRVHSGDTLHSLAGKYRTTVANLQRWNGLPGTALRPGQRLVVYYGEKGDGPVADADAAVSVSGGRLEYRVQQGDTLNSIARKFSAGVDDLLRWNNLTNDSVIHPGDKLLVGDQQAPPAAGRHTTSGASGSARSSGQSAIKHQVRRGDTLHKIARMYDVTVRQVRDWNGIGADGLIYPGQVLSIRP
jgi:peptidoglycan lytic transglycosylase D